MAACSRFETDLALMAGGDLPLADRAAVRAHVEACSACAALLEGLEADQEVFRGLGAAAAPPGSLALEVADRIEAGALTPAPAPARRAGAGWLAAAAGAAAALALAAALVVPGAGPGTAVVATPSDEIASYRPIHVQRAGRDGLELSWDGDGREAAPGGAKTYQVLASASARDFSQARPVEVAGSHLLTTMDFPAARGTDRSVTYFRVQ